MRTFDLNSEEHFPLYGLPHAVTQAILEIAEARQVPIDFAVAPALVYLGTAAGSKTKVVNDYTNTLNLFAGVIGSSASNKSTPAKDLRTPLDKINEELFNEYMAEKAKAEETKTNPQQNGSKPANKVLPRQIIIMDSTPEARFDALAANPHGLLWFRDELAAIFQDMGRYNKSGEASDLLSIYDGNGLSINRKNEGFRKIRSPFLSVFGTTQPATIRDIFGKTIFMHQGLIPRFIWFYPKSVPMRDYSKSRSPYSGFIDGWNDTIRRIYEKRNEDRTIRLSESARAVLDEFRNRTGNGNDNYETTVWGKLHIVVYKLAGIAVVARCGASGSSVMEVTEEDMCWAIDCAYYFHRTALEVADLCEGATPREITREAVLSDLLRTHPNVNQSQLAKSLGVSPQYISNVKRKANAENA